jgi:hypothetical protein
VKILSYSLFLPLPLPLFSRFPYLISLWRCGGANAPNLDQFQDKVLTGGEHWTEEGGALGLGLAVTVAKVARQPEAKEVHLTTHTLYIVKKLQYHLP